MTDIRTREDVLRVAEEMGVLISLCDGQSGCPHCKGLVVTTFYEGCGKKFITMSVCDLAFFMRDKCDKNKWFAELKTLCKPESWPQIMLEYTTQEQWIEAAVKAWSIKDDDAGDES